MIPGKLMKGSKLNYEARSAIVPTAESVALEPTARSRRAERCALGDTMCNRQALKRAPVAVRRGGPARLDRPRFRTEGDLRS